jgi:hypothetical protein
MGFAVPRAGDEPARCTSAVGSVTWRDVWFVSPHQGIQENMRGFLIHHKELEISDP